MLMHYAVIFSRSAPITQKERLKTNSGEAARVYSLAVTYCLSADYVSDMRGWICK